MLPKWPMLLSLLAIFIFFSSFTHGGSQSHFQSPPLPDEYREEKNEDNVVFSRLFAEGPNVVVEPPVQSSSLLLAAKRTYRKDPLNGFNRYTGGWNIDDRHYWASVAFTAAPFFITALICIGCVILYTGQEKFHSSTINTLDYVVHQANDTADNLMNVSVYLAAAKQLSVDRILIPANVQTDIDYVQTKITSSASTLSTKTADNKDDIEHLIESVLVIFGWILITGTLILCGIFLVLHNVTADTCVAMDEWIQNPTARTALDDILPCVDYATAQETLTKSKEVSYNLVDIVNQVITNVSNINFSPNFAPFYYNQSGPVLPILCNLFNPDLTSHNCGPAEVDLDNATQVLNNYVCQVSPSGICITPGRLTPTLYSQMAAAVNMSSGLYHYSPFLVELQNCDFVRETFGDIYNIHCPGLLQYSKRVYVGLVMVTIAVLLSVTFWIIYARERRHRVHKKEPMSKLDEGVEVKGDKPTHEE
ncbi:putative trafficking protein particle complex subunit 9-like [Capsicum annuum]|nr:putative trafficking protein particle complex subunit 9-like [Capsicum annuum]